jgi:hypothetical protein
VAVQDLCRFITDATIAYRKGAEVTTTHVGDLEVITVDGYPETPSRGQPIDVHFLNIGFTEAAAIDPAEFAKMIHEARDGVYCELSIDDLAGGPSYITLGAWLGSQDLALRFIALGAHLGLWSAVTPAAVGIEGEAADRIAGNGFVMSSGLAREFWNTGRRGG